MLVYLLLAAPLLLIGTHSNSAMPVAQGPSVRSRGALLAGLAAIVVAAIIIGAVLLASNGGSNVELKIGDSDFRNIDASRLATEINDNGPVPFSDLVGSNRAVWVNHLGGTSEDGWISFFARVPEKPDCLVEWNRDDRVFFDVCDPTTTYPPTGEGLELIPTRVEDGNLIIDINRLGEEPEG